MLWQSTLRPIKKLAATLVLSAGVLIVVCATLKSVYVLVVSFAVNNTLSLVFYYLFI
jgi:hypothetical protein